MGQYELGEFWDYEYDWITKLKYRKGSSETYEATLLYQREILKLKDILLQTRSRTVSMTEFNKLC